jgi:hypothetical protein
VPQHEHFAIDFVEAVQGLLDFQLQFGAAGGGGRRCQSAHQMMGEADGAGLRQRGAKQRNVVARAALLRPQVAPMGVDQLLCGELPQPEIELHRRLGRIVGQTAGGFDHRFLDDVRGIDPAIEPTVEPQADHVPQPVAVAAEQFGNGPLVAPRRLSEQFVNVWHHRLAKLADDHKKEYRQTLAPVHQQPASSVRHEAHGRRQRVAGRRSVARNPRFVPAKHVGRGQPLHCGPNAGNC